MIIHQLPLVPASTRSGPSANQSVAGVGVAAENKLSTILALVGTLAGSAVRKIVRMTAAMPTSRIGAVPTRSIVCARSEEINVVGLTQSQIFHDSSRLWSTKNAQSDKNDCKPLRICMSSSVALGALC